jgi:hypothetical protein
MSRRRVVMLALALAAPLLSWGGCGGPPEPVQIDQSPSPQVDEVHDRYSLADYQGTENRAQSAALIDLDFSLPTKISLRARLVPQQGAAAGSGGATGAALIDWTLTSIDYHLEPGADASASSATLVLGGLTATATTGVAGAQKQTLDMVAMGELRLPILQASLQTVQVTFPAGLPAPFPLGTRALRLSRDLAVP